MYIPNGFDHAVWGADVTLAPLNLCAETLDGIRNHSWKRPAPSTPEGAVVSWADRIGYVCHDWSDAIRAGVVTPHELPQLVAEHAGDRQSAQLRFFTNALIEGISTTGSVCMPDEAAVVLDEFRRFNYDWIYLREDSRDQARKVITILTALCDHLVDHPDLIPGLDDRPQAGSAAAGVLAVRYLATMTDRHAFGLARRLLEWPKDQLPQMA
jgi:dGTPase